MDLETTSNRRVTAPDGATLTVHSTGTGHGVVVVHGGGVTVDVYRRLAARLAATGLTVHRYNRRGRADAPPRREPYTVEAEVEDLAVVLAATGSRRVLGHSSGALIALTAAPHLPIDRLALYDAAVGVDGSFPTAWLDSAREAAHSGDIARSLAIASGGINTHSPAARLPLAVRTALCRAFLRTPIGRTMGELLPSTLDESHLVRETDGPAHRWSNVGAEVLLVYGTAGPPYYRATNEALAAALPRARVLPIPRSGHDGINRAPDRIVEPLAAFLAAE